VAFLKNKRKWLAISAFFIIVFIIVFAFISCRNTTSSKPKYTSQYSVDFVSNGGSYIASIIGVNHGDTIDEPIIPTREVGYLFTGWYADSSFTDIFIFTTAITTNITLYAKWDLTLNIGDLGSGGGRIFYRNDTGFTLYDSDSSKNKIVHYLEAAPSNEGSTSWGSNLVEIPNVTIYTTRPSAANYIGHGLRDTQRIVTFNNDLGLADTAAHRCISATHGGKNDWFLPSTDELEQLFANRTTAGITLTGAWHWTSTQYVGSSAWVRNTGSETYGGKNNTTYVVIAIRAF
jgi:uncharacterized repeat protein (TIGR02543 family)